MRLNLKSEQTKRLCDKETCTEEALFRAPKSRTTLNEYYYFCKPHAREYNEQWDFFAGMDSDQISDYQKSGRTWERPTWVTGTMASPDSGAAMDFQDQMKIFRNTAGIRAFFTKNPHKKHPADQFSTKTLAHLAILGLDESATMDDIKEAYKRLVKKHHPDKTGGDAKSEEIFKNITAAYQAILKLMSKNG